MDARTALTAIARRNSPFTYAGILAELPALTEIEHHVELSAKEAALYEAIRRSALEKLDGPGDAPKKNSRCWRS